MELRHLRYFDVLCQELHFAKAAARLRIAQPALSIQIKNLEHELGTRLLQRSRRKVELTHSGALFLVEARKTLAQAQNSIDVAKRAERGEVGRISIDFTRHAAHAGVLYTWLHAFNKRYGDVEVVLREVTPREQFDGLKDRTADIAFVTTFADGAALSLAIQEIAKIPMVVALPAFHRLAKRKRISIDELRDEAFVALNINETLPVRDVLGFTPRAVRSVTSDVSMLNLIAAGFGIGIVPQTVSTYGISSSVKYCRLEPAGPEIIVGLAYDAGGVDPVVKAFLSCASSR